ncbi:MAG: WecB/TagA/CpsF family glycosyltransferase [Candidatus Omnitrophica bacterium]|nr:UDP-N-acetyl-D-mannosaminuronic acid transferase [bacterium]NUN95435.1 WecB/TagA/CpsF family glycosyltransferase [Candidatus Omnitrophota bacterium]
MPWLPPFPASAFDFLGVRIHRLDRAELLSCFERALEEPGQKRFAYLNVAVSNQSADDPRVGELLNRADLVYVDGAGIQLGCKLLGAWCPPRNTGADFLPEVLELCARRGWSVGFLGGSPGAAERVRKIYMDRIPQLVINFVRDGYTGVADWQGCHQELLAARPDLLLVGLGVPLQEEWIETHRTEFPVRLYWSVGALFEYDGGGLSRCPGWMGPLGLEWLYRLLMEPGRLWKRYLVGNPRFLLRCLCSRWLGRGGMR